MALEKENLHVEYLKEHYTQARQHENRQTSTTTFLVSAAGLLLGLMVKDGHPQAQNVWLGFVISLIGVANWAIISAHHLGNRIHTTIARNVRDQLEELTGPTDQHPPGIPQSMKAMRRSAFSEVNNHMMGELNPDFSVGEYVYKRLRWVPWGTILVGFLAASFVGLSASNGTHTHDGIPQTGLNTSNNPVSMASAQIAQRSGE